MIHYSSKSILTISGVHKVRNTKDNYIDNKAWFKTIANDSKREISLG